MWQKTEQEIDPTEWNQYVATHGPESGRFLHAWEWGNFEQAIGEQVERFVYCVSPLLTKEGVRGWSGSVEGVAQTIERHLSGFGSYVYCPRGPITSSLFEERISDLLTQFPNRLFFRFDPPISLSAKKTIWYKTIASQPKQTWITDLTQTEETLFAELHKKTRYNIGLAQRSEIEIRFDTRDLEIVWPLFEQTASRGQFRLHGKQHYLKLLAALPFAFFATAWHEGRPIAVNLMIDFAGVRTYLHGASSYEHRALMAPQLLHWELIKDAQKKGLALYDWWGVAPINEPKHSWAGISRFKRSFPGRDVSYPGTYDLVQKPFWYNVYRLARRLRRAI